MTLLISGQMLANKITALFPDAVVETGSQAVVLKSKYLLKIAEYLKNSPDFLCHLLNDITSVDYFDYFEIVYRLTSIELNQALVFKVRCYDREHPEIPSLISLWKGADFMEREIFDLMGISFSGHPNMKRIFLWEGFKGHPLRKDYA
jgi:NADH-quinone oxidoreductase subunit C